MQQRPAGGGFNWAGLSMGTKGALVGGLIFLINMFIPWWNSFSIDLGPFGGGSVGGGGIGGFNTAFGLLAGLFCIALVVWAALDAFGVLANMTAPTKMITAILAGGTALFGLLRALIKPAGFSYGIGTWLGLLLSLALAYVAYVNWQEHQAGAGGMAPPPAPPVA